MKIRTAAASLTATTTKISNKPKKEDLTNSLRIIKRTKAGFQSSTRMIRKTVRKIRIIELKRKVKIEKKNRKFSLALQKIAL